MTKTQRRKLRMQKRLNKKLDNQKNVTTLGNNVKKLEKVDKK